MSNNNLLGTIIYSILSESLFQKVNGESWILLDGRNIEGSDLYELTGMKEVPDVRGLFMRALNCNKTENTYDVERKVGEFQDDNTRLPRNSAFGGVTTSGGEHTHLYPTAGIWLAHRTWQGMDRTEDNPAQCSYVQNGYTTATGSTHSHHLTINSGGDSETRPKNMAFYVYIKINN